MSDLEHKRYADWDAAYVLGSLSRSERTEYEAHLADCKICRTAIGDLAPLPGLLARVDEAEALAMLEEPAEAVAPVVSLEPRRRRPRFAVLAAGIAAAALVLTAILVPILGNQTTPSTAASISLSKTVPSPLTASVKLTAMTWGTRIDMTCTYAGYEGAQSAYRLYVVDRSGRSSLVSSWHAGPGEVARTTGSSDLSPSQIAAVQVRNAGGEVLLTGRA
ncbi:MAG: anti-sigma factor family protein [Marmoricola sp.]